MTNKNFVKNNLNTIIIIAVVLTIIAIVLGSGIIPQTAISGSSLISLTKVDLTSNFGPLSGQLWVYTFRQGGLGQVARGTISPGTAGSLNPGDEIPEKTFEMKVTYEDQECVYDIITTNEEQISTNWQLVEWNEFGSCDFSQSSLNFRCGSKEKKFIYSQQFDLGGKCNVICATERTTRVGRFDSPDINSKFEVEINVEGDISRTNFETLGESRGLVGPNTYIIWQGNLDTGKSCDDKDPFKPVYRQGQWLIVSQSDYDSYENSRATIITISNDDDAEIFVNTLNNKGNTALQIETFGDSITSRTSVTNGKVVQTVKDSLQFPVITAYIKASFIGIHTPIGTPRIISASTGDFQTSGLAKITVKNIGDEQGIFETTVSCPSPMRSDDRSEQSFQPGETKDIFLQLSADVSTETTRTCTARVDGIAETVTKQFSVTALPFQSCVPGTRQCTLNGNAIEQCNQDGVVFVQVESCDLGCDFNNFGTPFCKEDTPPLPPINNGVVCEPWIDSPLLRIDNPFCGLVPFFPVVSVVVAILLSLAIFSIGTFKFIRPNLKKRKQVTTRNILTIIMIIVSIIIGFIIFLLLSNILPFLITLVGTILTVVAILVIIVVGFLLIT